MGFSPDAGKLGGRARKPREVDIIRKDIEARHGEIRPSPFIREAGVLAD